MDVIRIGYRRRAVEYLRSLTAFVYIIIVDRIRPASFTGMPPNIHLVDQEKQHSDNQLLLSWSISWLVGYFSTVEYDWMTLYHYCQKPMAMVTEWLLSNDLNNRMVGVGWRTNGHSTTKCNNALKHL